MAATSMMFKNAASPGGGGASVPTDLSGLWFWHEIGDFYSDAGTTLQTTNGGSVQQWSTRGGSSRHLTGSNKPTLDTGTTYNGHATLRFTAASNQYLRWPDGSMPGTAAGEIFAVLKAVSDSPSATRALWDLCAEGNAGNATSYYPDTSGHIWEGFASTLRKDAGAPGNLSSGFHVYNVDATISGLGPLNVRLDGSLIYSVNGVGSAFNKIGTFFGADEFGNPWDGWAARVFAFNRVLTTTERADMLAFAQS